MYFRQEKVISTLNAKTLKLVNQFRYLGSNISSTESDFDISIEKERIAID